MKHDVDIMMIGHFARDRLVVDGQAEMASGGGIYYGSIALRRLGVRVAVATRLHPDDLPRLDELKQEGVQVFATAAPETSGIENIYHSSDMERRVCKPLGFAGAFSQAEIPDLAAQIYAVVPIMAGEVDLPLLQALARRGPTALDVQGFVRVREVAAPLSGDPGGPSAGSGQSVEPALVFRHWPDMQQGLAEVSYLKVDRAEAELLTGCSDLSAAARKLAGCGPREVLITQSSGVTVFAEGRLFQAPFSPRSLAGRTGRGDTCFAIYLGCRLTRAPEEATRLAAAITTLKQEQPGPWRGTLADVAARGEGLARGPRAA